METVLVIFGGQSAEHDVSIVTALASVIKPLELSRIYNVQAVYIAKDGRWFWDARLKDITLFTSGKIEDFMRKQPTVSINFMNGLVLQKRRKKLKADIVFPALHGTNGEDGALMGLLELAGVPYVGCGISASAVCMDKVLAKQQAVANGLPVSKFVSVRTVDFENDVAAVVKTISTLKYPLFVKPAHLGSSIGISRVTNGKDLTNALEVAAHYDQLLIVEEAVQNLVEVTLPIIGNDQPKPGLLESPLTTPEDFFDFDTKYLHGSKKGKGGGKKADRGAQGYSKIPADLPKPVYDQAEKLGLAIYTALGCSGIARVDMLIDIKAKKTYFNEVNPLPGSLYAHNWAQAGISGVELVQELINYAKQRHATEKSVVTSFKTNYLQQF
jgi:D-alanine-D-alanine ligase